MCSFEKWIYTLLRSRQVWTGPGGMHVSNFATNQSTEEAGEPRDGLCLPGGGTAKDGGETD